MTTRRKAGEVSLERALSKRGICSRSEAHRLIAAGRVAVDGLVVRDPGRAVVPERIKIAIDGKTEGGSRKRVVLMLHKPIGTVVTRRDPEGRPTVYGLLGEQPIKVEAVGRLDLMTSGLLLFTSDARLADWLLDPRHEVPRRYLVRVRGAIATPVFAPLLRGVSDRGERLVARRVEVRRRSRAETRVLVELVEGKNREVRRLMDAIGCETTELTRSSFGGLELGRLASGAWREVPEAEWRAAFPAAP